MVRFPLESCAKPAPWNHPPIWNLVIGASLGFGVWDLELSPRILRLLISPTVARHTRRPKRPQTRKGIYVSNYWSRRQPVWADIRGTIAPVGRRRPRQCANQNSRRRHDRVETAL